MQFFPLQRFFQFPMRASPIRSYECMSMESVNRAELNSGGKILLPQSALEDFLQMTTSDVMLFSVQNIQTNKRTHCGVLEFVAEEGVVHLPRWMMQTLDVTDRRIVQISIIQLPKGSFVKLQPHTQAFCSISNPRAVLEIELRKFATLTKGDAIMITYNAKNYYFNILEVKDESGAQVEAVSIIEVNLQVDFETPLDYVEPVKPVSSPNLSNVTPKVVEEKKEEPVEQDTGFKPFSGSGYSLRDNRKPPSYNNSNNNNNNNNNKNNNDRSISSPNLSRSSPSISNPSLASSPPQGDLVFSDNSVKDPSKRVRKREPEQPSQAKKQSGFVPFQGEGRSLK